MKKWEKIFVRGRTIRDETQQRFNLCAKTAAD